MPPSGLPYRLAYLNAWFIAFMTDSGGPYGFSLLDSLANASYSSTEARGRAACAPGTALRPCANTSATPTFRDPRAAATVPTKLRRETARFTSIRPLRSNRYFTRKPVDEPG